MKGSQTALVFRIFATLCWSYFSTALPSNSSASDSQCIDQCTLSCGCPIGPNERVCSGHGQCMDQSCACSDNWVSKYGHSKTCETEIFEIHDMTYYVIIFLASLSIIIAIISSVIYFVYRKREVMILSRPSFGHLMNFGVLLGCITLIYAVHVTKNKNSCTVIWCMLDYSFVFVFGTLMAKTYRNFRILRNTQKKEQLSLTDGWVLRVLLFMIALETILLLCLYLTDHLEAGVQDDDGEYMEWKLSDGTFQRFYGCFLNSFVGILVIFIMKFVIVVMVCAFSFRLRNVKNASFNEFYAIFLSSGIVGTVWLFAIMFYILSSTNFGNVFLIAGGLCICLPYMVINISLLIPKLMVMFSHKLNSSVRRRTISTSLSNQSFFTPTTTNEIVGGDMNCYLFEIDWNDVRQVEEAEEALTTNKGYYTLQIDTILLLLSDTVRHRGIRAIAVASIEHFPSAKLQLYLPQFLQALKYEPSPPAAQNQIQFSSLFQILLLRAAEKDELALAMYWYIQVELASLDSVLLFENGVPCWQKHEKTTKRIYETFLDHLVDPTLQHGFHSSENLLLSTSFTSSHFKGADHTKDMIESQTKFMREFSELYTDISSQKSDVKAKTNHLQTILTDPTASITKYFTAKGSVYHPLYPSFCIKYCVPSKCCIFRSSAKPMKMCFEIDEKHLQQRIEKQFHTGRSQGTAKGSIGSEGYSTRYNLNDNARYDSASILSIRYATSSSFSSVRDVSVVFDETACTTATANDDDVGIELTPPEQDLSSFVYTVSIKITATKGLIDVLDKETIYAIVECHGKSHTIQSELTNSNGNVELIWPQDGVAEIVQHDLYERFVSLIGVSPTEVEITLCKGEHHFIAESSIDLELLGIDAFTKKKNWYPLSHHTDTSMDCGEIEVEIALRAEDFGKDFEEALQKGATKAIQKTVSSLITGTNLQVIYKVGDDLRQDQLALQLIAVMDSLFKEKGLDMKLTPYRALAISPNEGFLEFVENSYPLSRILSENHQSILEFLRKHHFDLNAEHHVKREAMDTYIRSVAAYCVITYVLGVGDRHLDNLMLKDSGHFFHIDFGFMFGKDPKPFPPPFRLTPEMVTAMGGLRHMDFEKFESYAAQCFNVLRNSAHVILGILRLMTDAGVPDLKENPIKAIEEVRERLVLHGTDKDAEKFMKGMIRHSQRSKTTTRLTIMEQFHKFAVAIQ